MNPYWNALLCHSLFPQLLVTELSNAARAPAQDHRFKLSHKLLHCMHTGAVCSVSSSCRTIKSRARSHYARSAHGQRSTCDKPHHALGQLKTLGSSNKPRGNLFCISTRDGMCCTSKPQSMTSSGSSGEPQPGESPASMVHTS